MFQISTRMTRKCKTNKQTKNSGSKTMEALYLPNKV